MDADPEATQIMSQILLIVFLTAINAFFAGAEMAIVSVNKNKIKRLAEEGNKKALLIQKQLADSTKFLSTIQVAITFANFFSSASAASGIAEAFGLWLNQFKVPFSETLAMIVVTVVLSFLTLVFGELVPKRIALQKAETFSLFSIQPIYFVSRALAPFIRFLSMSTNFVLQIVGMKAENIEELVSEEEIKALLESGSEQGVFNDIEKEMIQSIFSFDDKTAKDVMVPRKDVFAININEPLKTYIDSLLESRYSKIPVYRDNIDNIVGVLQMKDFYLKAKETSFYDVKIEDILQQPYFVPESKNTDVLFREIQKKKNNLAVIIDEYGGFSGIVAVEDLVEEVMGKINNEYEQEEPELQKLDLNTYRAEGTMLVDDLNRQLHIKLETGQYDTLSGFIIEKLGYIPKEDDSVEITADNVKLKVETMSSKAIGRVIITMPEDKVKID